MTMDPRASESTRPRGVRLAQATDVVVANSEYVVVTGCRCVYVDACTDVKVASTAGLATAGQNTWGGPGDGDFLVTNGDVAGLLRAKPHIRAKNPNRA